MQSARKLRAAAVHDRNLMVLTIGKIDNRASALAHELFVIEGGAADFHYDLQLRPSRSSNPHIMFMFCTACPAAPFIKLSRHETITMRLPSGLRLKPTSQ